MNLATKADNLDLDFKIALDGPSASGKGLIGLMLAEEFGLKYFQSSIVYRGLAFICVENQIDLNNTQNIIDLARNPNILEKFKNIDTNSEVVGNIASQISTIKEVRTCLTSHLVQLVKNTPRIVMEGRDIGTVVAPDADIKIFIFADVQVRAKRRFKQLQLQGKECILGNILESLKERDARDINRTESPLRAADDALVIDTTDLTPFEVILKIKDFIYKSAS
jgi:CMP/dCMP kinase